MVQNEILLTGIPRSGTTLACSLLDQVEDCVALVEPLDMEALLRCEGKAERHRYIRDFMRQVRSDVAQGKGVPRRIAPGATNTFATVAGSEGRRGALIGSAQETQVERRLSPDFTLVLKHPNAFAALLRELREAFRCYALIRHPLAVLGSWSSLDHQLSAGHAPMAERFDPALQQRLAGIDDALERQLHLLDWYYRQFDEWLPIANILRYEDVVATQGRMLNCIHPGASRLREPLQSRNHSALYDAAHRERAAERLRRWPEHAALRFYELA